MANNALFCAKERSAGSMAAGVTGAMRGAAAGSRLASSEAAGAGAPLERQREREPRGSSQRSIARSRNGVHVGDVSKLKHAKNDNSNCTTRPLHLPRSLTNARTVGNGPRAQAAGCPAARASSEPLAVVAAGGCRARGSGGVPRKSWEGSDERVPILTSSASSASCLSLSSKSNSAAATAAATAALAAARSCARATGTGGGTWSASLMTTGWQGALVASATDTHAANCVSTFSANSLALTLVTCLIMLYVMSRLQSFWQVPLLTKPSRLQHRAACCKPLKWTCAWLESRRSNALCKCTTRPKAPSSAAAVATAAAAARETGGKERSMAARATSTKWQRPTAHSDLRL